MKIIKGLMLLLAVGILAVGCYWTPNEGEAELSLTLPKSITEKAPPDLYYAKITIIAIEYDEKGDPTEEKTVNFVLAMPSFANAHQGVIPLKLPAGEYMLTIMMDIDSDWTDPEFTGDSGPESFFVPPAGRTKVEVVVKTAP